LPPTLGEALTAIADAPARPPREPEPWPALAPLRGLPYYTYRHNLLEHVGHLSVRENGTYGGGDGPATSGDAAVAVAAPAPPAGAAPLRGSRGRLCYPACYGAIQYVGLMPDENFADACLHAPLSPCAPCDARAVDRGLARRRAERGGADGAVCVGLSFPAVLAKVEASMRAGAC